MAETVLPRIYGVSQLNYYLKEYLEEDDFLSELAIRGEISGCKYHSSGHIYFTLKEGEYAIRSVMFRNYALKLETDIHDGDRVVVLGSVSMYQRDGSCQIYARQIFPDGQGQAAMELDKLRRRLESEGLFAPENKQPLPRYVFDMGVITSPQGAAWADIQRIAYGRNPNVRLTIYPAAVQGENAPTQLAEALKRADAAGHDVLLIGRGGGANEDLAAFDTEQVVRAVAQCETPVVSAVGHESDLSLCDLAADMRAATPTHGAALTVTDRAQVLEYLEQLRYSAAEAVWGCISKERQRLERLDIKGAFGEGLYRREQQLGAMTAVLASLDPLAVLMRGYSVVTDSSGKALRSAAEAEIGDALDIRLAKGSLSVSVSGKKEDNRG